MKKLNLFLMLVMFGFGMMLAPSAHAVVGEITTAPCEGITESSGVFVDAGTCGVGPLWNARIAIAPYAQVVAGSSYTFIGISHPSLATAHTSIGVVVEALDMVTVPNTRAGRSTVFTVSAGETHRVFIVNQTHDTINLNNAAFTDSQTHLITTTDADQFGNVKVWSIGTAPSSATTDAKRPGQYTNLGNTPLILRFDNLAQLAMWGVIYQESNGAGFAMEFVGDMHDSSALGSVTHEPADGTLILLSNTSGTGRGVN